ncbi:hypothetical protein RHGRI_036952 [Rhododendron griersonianum]|uniref:Uncharacterized protein n=1 Tax=Rhododendron griersonianum TaxID=479676 RepID=A0AAV6HU09_9ERIC|nr:hypothetical protein RHGRI_036952 [Rhododendron griersonianum]
MMPSFEAAVAGKKAVQIDALQCTIISGDLVYSGPPLMIRTVLVSQDSNKIYASIFSPFWNEIIKSLRKEDFISTREKDLLSKPSNSGSKILLAVDLALDCKDTQADLWNKICRDEYMAYAVQECFCNTRNETTELAKGAAKAVNDFYEVVTHDLLSSDLRELLDTWNILLRARNEGRLFSRIEWPKDPENKEQVKRLHLLLTVKDSATNIPKNLEARRLEFFTNSLFMDMPTTKPVSEMMPSSAYRQNTVFTPYYSETVLYSSSELRVENEDGISTLFYLQKIFPVRGMMYHRRALMLQSFLENRSLEEGYSQANFLTAEVTLVFDVSIKSYIFDLVFRWGLQRQCFEGQLASGSVALRTGDELTGNEALRVAFIHVEVIAAADGTILKEFYSKLVKADINGKDQEIFSNKLLGDPKLGEGKPENQNHAIIFTRGEAVQSPLT